MAKPIFYDPSGKRSRWSRRGLVLLVAALFSAVAVLIFSVMSVAIPSALPVAERNQPKPLPAQIYPFRHAVKKFGRDIGGWLPKPRRGAEAINQFVAGFYVPWDPDSRASLVRHVGDMDWLAPVSLTVVGAKHDFNVLPDNGLDAILSQNTDHHPKLFPTIQNADKGQWDGAGTSALLHDPAARKHLIDQLIPFLKSKNAAGVVYDLEEISPAALPDYLKLLAETRARFAPMGWLVTLTVPAGDAQWQISAFAKVSDKIFLMDYDEHEGSTPAGPIASQNWFVQNLQSTLKNVPSDKIILAVGSYGYDWHNGTADNMTIEEAWLAASESDAKPVFDKVSGNSTFSYEENGQVHNVWYLDAVSAWNQVRVADTQGVAGVALWRLGGEDPGVWEVFRKFQGRELPDLATVSPAGNPQITGKGELFRIKSKPVTGTRTVTFDKDRVAHNEVMQNLPTPFQIERFGYQPKMVALTFDDGPDANYTQPILDVLEAKHVPATFFIIGENALSHPATVNRIINGSSGSEIGSHTYTHPNLAEDSEQGVRLELNLTQRVVQAYTGHSLRLFRAPYMGDAEPTTSDELTPASLAQDNGYTNVGLHVDPGDWKRPGVAQIVNDTVNEVVNGQQNSNDPDKTYQVVLLHDGGGDRQQTVAALPLIIDRLQALGYQFVPISKLAGLKHQDVMPAVSGSDLLAVRADVGIFLFVAGVLWAMKWLFYVAISLGIARAVSLAALALWSNMKRNAPQPPVINPQRFVSVLIPAYNEERVIADSIRRVLVSEQVHLEIIVIDDGSKDSTAAIVKAEFGTDRRVQLLQLVNGGKAHALNQGIKLAKGDVIIALDADTQFEPLTIARLARWFDDPEIGAVAGNAKVGNKINLVTRWQAIEYITAQNLERRALDQLEAITVVPGAVGAWRRAALDDVGGYPVDTLAEDQDLTIAVQRAGWVVAYDVEAVAWTESPESFKALAKQRFRWAFGTLQCLWKHRVIMRTGKPIGLAIIGIPQAWVFQIAFAVISPIIDLALVISIVTTIVRVFQHGWAQTQSDVLTMGIYWLAFTSIDVVCGWVAYRLETRKEHYPAILLVAQRFVYRQVMYWVVLRAVRAALQGPSVGWGKIERTGSVGGQHTPA